MPGRPSGRTSNASRACSKPSPATLASRRSTITPFLLVSEEGHISSLRTEICKVFGEAQKSAAGHRKLLVGLRKVQEVCCYEPTRPGKHGRQSFNENDFNMEIGRCVIRLMAVKRSEVTGDRVVRFLGSFLRHATDKGIVLGLASFHRALKLRRCRVTHGTP